MTDLFNIATPAEMAAAREEFSRAGRYLRICDWARNRYSYGGNLVIAVGGQPSAYTRIERAAWARYMA